MRLLQPVTGRSAEIVERSGKVKLLELAERWPLDVCEPGDAIQLEKRLGLGACERQDGHNDSNARRD